MFLKDTDSFIETSGSDLWEQNLGAGDTLKGHLAQPPMHCLSQQAELNCTGFVQLKRMTRRSLFQG